MKYKLDYVHKHSDGNNSLYSYMYIYSNYCIFVYPYISDNYKFVYTNISDKYNFVYPYISDSWLLLLLPSVQSLYTSQVDPHH